MSTARAIHAGTPAADFPLEESIVINFHDFANLTAEKGQCVNSPIFSCAGYKWKLRIYPGGHSNSRDGMIGIFVYFGEAIVASYCIFLLKSGGAVHKAGRGNFNFVSRAEILEESNHILNNGALSFLVRLRIKPNKKYYHHIMISQPSIADNIFNKLFNDKDSADVAFIVKGVVYYAHRLILKVQAPELLDLSEQFDMETKMPINDVEPATFEIMLRFVYGQNILPHEWKDYSKSILEATEKYGLSSVRLKAEVWYVKMLRFVCGPEWKEHSKPILEAAGKYGPSTLRLKAEAWHVLNLDLSVDSAIDELLYADGFHCLLLKKAVMDFIVENGQAVITSPSFAKLAESTKLMKEVMLETFKSNESRKRKRDD